MIENNLDTLTEQQYLDLRYEIIRYAHLNPERLK